MDNDNYVYELERALTELLEFFEPSNTTYCLYDGDDNPFTISEEMALVVDHANEVLYGETVDD